MLKITLFIVGVLVSAATILYALFSSPTVNGQPSSFNGPLATASLKFLIVVSRHGNRGSAFDYPGDPYLMNNTKYWPYGAAGLTPNGRNQMYNLGVKIRSLYTGFLPVTYRSEDIRATSTYMDRLLISGEAFLAGLYPPKGFQIWNSGLKWQPSALYSDSPDRTVDVLMSTTYHCQRYFSHFDSVLEQMNEKYGPLLKNVSKYVQNVTGVDTSSYGLDIGFVLWDKISNEVSEGYTVPEWTRKVYPEQLLPFVTEEYKLCFAGCDEVSRLMAGEMFEQMLNTMIQKVNGSLTPDRKMLFYSGHDTSIMALQRIIGVSYDYIVGVVRPGSALVIELHQKNETQQYYIQARYIDGTDLEQSPQAFNITSDFDSFVDNSQKYIHVNFLEECEDTNMTRQML